MRKYVLTGPPGSGKSTTRLELEKMGYPTIPEVAERLILREKKKAEEDPSYDPIIPESKRNYGLFQSLVSELVTKEEEKIPFPLEKPWFLDRSHVDQAAYSRIGKVEPPVLIKEKIQNANYGTVFFHEALPVHVNSNYRHETPEEAAHIGEVLLQTYYDYGLDVVKVPFMGMGEKGKRERAEFIRDHVESGKEREVEGKFRLKDEHGFRSRLSMYNVALTHRAVLRDTYHDIGDLLGSRGCYMRLRDEGDYKLTVKGPNKSDEVFDRFEAEVKIPGFVYSLMKKVLPQVNQVEKIRTTYTPVGDNGCKIMIDDIIGDETFVEIESDTHQIGMWSDRLLLRDRVEKTYSQMAKERNGNHSL